MPGNNPQLLRFNSIHVAQMIPKSTAIMPNSPSHRRSTTSTSQKAVNRPNVSNKPFAATVARSSIIVKCPPISTRDRGWAKPQLAATTGLRRLSSVRKQQSGCDTDTGSNQNEAQLLNNQLGNVLDIEDREENREDSSEIESAMEQILMDEIEVEPEPELEECEQLSEEQGFAEIDNLIDESIREHYPGRRKEDWERRSSVVAEREAITESHMKEAGEAIHFEVNADGECIVAKMQAPTETIEDRKKLEQFHRAQKQQPPRSSLIPQNREELDTSLIVRQQINRSSKYGTSSRQLIITQLIYLAVDGIDNQIVTQQRDLDIYLNQLHYNIEHALQAKTTLARYTPIQQQFIVRFHYGLYIILILIKSFCQEERVYEDGYQVSEMKIIDFLRTHAFKEGSQQKGKNRGKPLSTSSIMAIVTALCDLYNVCSSSQCL